MESWKPIKNYEGYYEVSDAGNIRSVDRTVIRTDGVVCTYLSRPKTISLDRDGYATVKLSKDGVDKRIFVHKIVAETFVDGWTVGAEVNHKDFNRTNNQACNLEWVSHAENIRYSIDSGRHSSQRDLRGSNNPNYNNHVLSERYRADKVLSHKKQSRPGAQNGRATSVTLYTDDKEQSFALLKDCAEHMIANHLCSSANVAYIASQISFSAKTSQPYCGCYFKINQ